MSFWDIGGSARMVCLWRHYAEGASCVLFFINPFGTEEQYSAAIQHLKSAILSQLPDYIPVILVHTKQDLHIPGDPIFLAHDGAPASATEGR